MHWDKATSLSLYDAQPNRPVNVPPPTLQVIGEGAFSKVHLGRWRGLDVAVKVRGRSRDKAPGALVSGTKSQLMWQSRL